MKKLYSYQTPVGTFHICRADRAFFSLLGNEVIDSCSTPEQAAGELARGDKIRLESGADPSKLEIPANLDQWEKLLDSRLNYGAVQWQL